MFEMSNPRTLPPRDPTTGRFISTKVEGIEDGSVNKTGTELFRRADPAPQAFNNRRFRFVPTDEVSDEMVGLALSPEDILIASEEEIDPEGEEDFEGDGDDAEYFVDLLWAEHERGDDEDADSESEDDLVDPADSFRNRPTVNRSDKNGTRGRPGPVVAARARRELLVSRMRRARRAAKSWLTKPDWSDEASASLEAEELVELEAKMEAARAEWDNMIEADLVFECEVYEDSLSCFWADLIEEREEANRLRVKAA